MEERLKEIYTIKPIDYKLAMEIVVKHHYLHRKCPCSQAFGLFEGENLVGVICYGTPSSSALRKGICGIEEAFNVIELTRLWIEDNTLKNVESYLIGNTIKLINKEIVVSYAEIQKGHLGIVYQATNWFYTGLSAKRTNWTIKGIDKHCQTIADKYTAKEIRDIYGDRFSLVDRPRKHRYVYFNANKKRKKELLNKLKYKIQPYPKLVGNNKGHKSE
jgi:hypothetical protein